MTDAPTHILLSGIVGSVAYGLQTPSSDVDRLGVFAAPTEAFHGLGRPAETHCTFGPDVTLHEARKYVKLALAANPTATELMWLPDELYETRTELGNELIAMRSAFLTAEKVRGAYLEYATSQLDLLVRRQFRLLASRDRAKSEADSPRRIAKAARHMYRLCWQGLRLYRTGELPIRLEYPEVFRTFGERVAAGDIERARKVVAGFREMFDAERSPLPDAPDEATVESWLLRVRAAYYDRKTADVVR